MAASAVFALFFLPFARNRDPEGFSERLARPAPAQRTRRNHEGYSRGEARRL
jgi:hypothetical protein